MIFSNSARVITVLQLGSAAALSAGGLSHNPLMVITGASGGTLAASASLFSAGYPAGDVPGCWAAGAGVGFAACPQAMAASSRQTNPNCFILMIPPGGSKRSMKIL